jgi:hypothetical protein
MAWSCQTNVVTFSTPKKRSNGAPVRTTIITRAPASDGSVGSGGAFVRSGLTRTTTDK